MGTGDVSQRTTHGKDISWVTGYYYCDHCHTRYERDGLRSPFCECGHHIATVWGLLDYLLFLLVCLLLNAGIVLL